MKYSIAQLVVMLTIARGKTQEVRTQSRLNRTRKLQGALAGDPVVQKFNATHNVSVPQPVPDSMAAINVFELFEAQVA